MSAFDKLAAEDRMVLETAAAWSERLRREPALEISTEFVEWVSVPANAHALEAVRSTMAALEDAGAAPAILDMRSSALARLRNAPRRLSVRRLAPIAAALMLLAVGAGFYVYYRAHAPVEYVAGIGEKKLVPLPDGSRIFLDSDSAVEVLYSRSSRSLKLDHGRARFDVAHDTTRPFTVSAGQETVVAVGTSFNVEKLGPKILITLLQGRVVVEESDRPLVDGAVQRGRPPVRLATGQQMVADGGAEPVIGQADLDAATAWEGGHLIFRGEPLGEAVLQMNRYTDNPVMVAPSAASIPVSGVFNAGDVGSFVSAITGYFPVDATTDGENRITLQKRT